MTRGGWIVLVGLVVVLGVGSLALMRALEPAEALAETKDTAATVDAPAAQPVPSAPLETTAEEPARAEVRATPKPLAAADAPVDDSELADAHWVEGRVVFPNETPLDEELWVVAQGRKFEKRPLHKVKVGADGRFRVAFAKKTKKGTVALDAHYLYLKEPVSLTASAPPEDLVLQPLVGGRIRGVCRVPLGRKDLEERARGASVQAWGWDESSRGGGGTQQRAAKLGADLAFDLGGLDPKARFQVSVQPKEMTAVQREDLDVKAGKALDLELELREGARVSGIVVDEAGAPIGNASLGTVSGNSTSWGADRASSKDGKFVLTGLEPGKWKLEVRRSGFLEAEHECGELADGDARTDVRIVLLRGASIRGRVQWPDGAPATGAWVRAETEDSERPYFSMEGGFKTEADGTFEVSGLAQGRFKLTATAKRSAEKEPVEAAAPKPVAAKEDAQDEAEEALAAAKRAKSAVKRGPSWTAELEGVASGASGIVLTLAGGHTLTGRVVDDAGTPVEAFSITATPVGDGEWDRDWSRRQNRSFKSPEGRFELEGLTPGRWEYQASLKGIDSAAERVDVPHAGDAQALVVPRAGTLRGRVVDAAGSPAPGARVHRVAVEEPQFRAIVDRSGSRKGTDWADCGADGAFAFDRVPLGPVRLVASADGAAESAPVDAVATLGEAPSVLIALRTGGTIRGLVLTDDGRPDAERRLQGWSEHHQGNGIDATTDAAGRFEIQHVSPGKWRLSPQPSAAEMRSAGEDFDWTAFQSRSRSVTVAEGQTVDVQLGGVEKDTVLVRGRVTRGGKALAGVQVHAWCMGARGEDEQRSASTKTKDGGVYELTVPRPGEWSFSFSIEDGASLSKQLTVPAGPAMTLDIEFPLGALRGRVVDRDGHGVAEQHLYLGLEEGVARDQDAMSSGNTQTDENGRFAFEGLAPGKYQVHVGAWWSGREGKSYGGVVQSGCTVPEKGEGTEVVIVLDVAGTIAATVVGLDGRPQANAAVHVLPVDAPDGRSDGQDRADARGKATIGGLAPGAYRVHASAGNDVAVEPARVVVRSGEKSEVQLTLTRGGALVVTARDADGKSVGAWCRIVDEHGADWTSASYPNYFGGNGTETPGVRYGPLPPGRYRLSSKNRAGVEASVEAVVTSGGEASVVMQYGSAPR